MNLIEKFENMPFQDVGTFNSIFKNSPILGFDFSTEVEIGNLTPDNQRRVKVGENVLFLDLTQKSRVEIKRVEKAKRKLQKVSLSKPKTLPAIYSMLTPTEFMVYLAIKELGEVDGVTTLAKILPMTTKTISNCLVKLSRLGLVQKKKVSDGEKTFLKIIDTRKLLD
jgi:DNA-binding MarR family transcriptional regulator